MLQSATVKRLNGNINMDWNSSETETLEELNKRFADGLLPLTVTFGCFVALGFFGNLLILLVFSFGREYKNNNFKIFVLCLALVDFAICVAIIPAEMVKHRNYFSFQNEVLCQTKCFFNVFGACSSCLTLLIISVDRFRRVCQPLRRQISPSLAVKLLFACSFVFPFILAIPGALMCGIHTADKVNIYGNTTEIALCAAAEKYQKSVFRKIYKMLFVVLLVGISATYVVLYTCVMKEVVKQIKSIANLRRNSYDVCYTLDTCDATSMAADRRVSNGGSESRNLVKSSLKGSDSCDTRDIKAILSSNKASVKSIRNSGPRVRRVQFPYKTIVWFILTIVFIVTYMINVVFTLNVNNILTMTPSQFAVHSFFYRIYFFNHVINPVVYALFLKTFRKSCRTLIPTLKKRILGLCQR